MIPLNRMSIVIGALVALTIVGVGVWYFVHSAKKVSVSKQSPTEAVAHGAATSPAQNPVVQNPTFGTIKSEKLEVVFLTGANGMTLYTYARDSIDTSACVGTCATTWPPYTVSSPADVRVPAIVKGEVSTIKRDNLFQVTYKGMPLYFYKKDKKKGDTTGHKVGGVWFVAKL